MTSRVLRISVALQNSVEVEAQAGVDRLIDRHVVHDDARSA